MNADIDLVFDALGDSSRRAIVGRLAAGPLDVRSLAEGLPIGRSAVSMHLRVLKEAGLVGDVASGNRRIYHLDPEVLQRLRDHLDWYWDRSLAAYKRAVEAKAKEQEMTTEPEIVVTKTVRVEAPVAMAFEVFVDQSWWPVQTHHLAESPGIEAVLEPFVGGRWYERTADGEETDWGTVLVWQPPFRILLTWQVSADWTYEADPDRGSQVEVTFVPESEDVTKVELRHRHLERYGADAEQMRRILESNAGEPLTAYARSMTTTTRPKSVEP